MSAVTQQQQQGPGARRVSLEQIAAVQTMIEKCMQLYMAKDEVMACLKDQANIEPNFSQLVWSKLEEQNADFFRAYNLRVQLKSQVVTFNQMLQQQLQVLESLQQTAGQHHSQCRHLVTSSCQRCLVLLCLCRGCLQATLQQLQQQAPQ
ncbi:hypothetical protein COO60DRAFT_1240596 [Scenedesmus sp. NREL 46B-D3]|nr:hypothetical protein COO60DRAFT_1240596 [Scenedesmus sp. NREL 46B-D3]